MLITEIRREAIGSEVVDSSKELLSIAEKAKELLGYNLLEASLAKSATVLAEETELRTVLRDLEIEILNPRDVFRYQKEQLIERTTELMREWMDRTAKDTNMKDRLDAFGGPRWDCQKIEEYRQPVPEFVLAKAVQIKERMPGCVVLIESLSDHPDPFLLVAPAPAKYSWQKPDECYAVEVWAEPKFEGRIGGGDDSPF